MNFLLLSLYKVSDLNANSQNNQPVVSNETQIMENEVTEKNSKASGASQWSR